MNHYGDIKMSCSYDQNNMLDSIKTYNYDNELVSKMSYTIEPITLSKNTYNLLSDYWITLPDDSYLLRINGYKVNEINTCEDTLACLNSRSLKFFYTEIEPNGIKDIAVKTNISIFPNPTSAILNIELPINENNNDVKIDILSVNGQSVFSKIDSNGGLKTLDIENLNPGMYVVKINTGKESFVKQIIKL